MPDAVTVSAAELAADPYAVYRRVSAAGGVGWSPELGVYLVTQWPDVVRLDDEDIFTAAVEGSPLRATIGPNMLHAAGAEHRRLRDAVAPLLRPGPLRVWVERVVPPIAAELLEPIVEHEGGDLLADYAEPLAVRVVAELLGLRQLPVDRLREWFNGIGIGAANYHGDPVAAARAEVASADVDAAVEPYLSGDAVAPADSLLHLLLNRADDPLTRDEVLGTVKLMIIGGMQEPRDLIGTALAALLTDQELQRRIRSTPTLVPRLLEEALRWNAPVGTITRRALVDVRVGEVAVPAGAMVAGVLAAANRDPDLFAEPDHFDIDRDRAPHMAFALGPHSCVGAGLARLLCRIGVEAVLSLEAVLQPVGEIAMVGWEFRGPASLPCLLIADPVA